MGSLSLYCPVDISILTKWISPFASLVESGPTVIELLFFMLNSAENDISNPYEMTSYAFAKKYIVSSACFSHT